MAIDGVELSAGSGGAVVATDLIGGFDYQYVKVSFGALDAVTLVTSAVGLPVGDAGGSLTVDGTVDLGATDNAVLDAIAASVAAIDTDTSTIIGHVDGLEGLIGTTNTNTGASTTALQIIDDWDESDRAKVNPIAGQAGVQGASGTVSALTQRVVLATDVALPAGTNGIGKLTANSGVDIGDVDVTSIAAGTNLIGDVGLQGRATGGLTIFRSIDLDESEEEVKATAGTLYSLYAFNATNAIIFVKLYNLTAANTTVGSSTPVLTLPVPANNDTDGAGFVWSVPQGLAFDTAISAAATTGVADADTGAPAANACVVNMGYK